MARFVVDLGDIELSKESQAQLANEIQTTALAHVARADFRKPLAVKFPIEWIGIIIRPDFDQLVQVEKELGRVMGGN